MSKWFYLVHGQQRGPIESAELKQLADLGQLKPSDKVKRQDMSQWYLASQVSGLFGVPPASKQSVARSPNIPPLSALATQIQTSPDASTVHTDPPEESTDILNGRATSARNIQISPVVLGMLSAGTTLAVVLILWAVVGTIIRPKSDAGESGPGQSAKGIQKSSKESLNSNTTSSPGQVKRSSNGTVAQSNDPDQQTQQFFGAMLQAAQQNAREQRKEDAAAEQWANKTFGSLGVCQACGGTGWYRYVDGYGNLQMKECPHCHGSGRL